MSSTRWGVFCHLLSFVAVLLRVQSLMHRPLLQIAYPALGVLELARW